MQNLPGPDGAGEADDGPARFGTGGPCAPVGAAATRAGSSSLDRLTGTDRIEVGVEVGSRTASAYVGGGVELGDLDVFQLGCWRFRPGTGGWVIIRGGPPVPLLPTACAASAARPPAGCWPSCCACRVCVSVVVCGLGVLGWVGLASSPGPSPSCGWGCWGRGCQRHRGSGPGGNDVDGP